MIVEMGDMEKEHADWVRSEAVKLAFQLHKYSPKIEEVLRDASAIAAFIFDKKQGDSAEVIPLRIMPKDGGDAA